MSRTTPKTQPTTLETCTVPQMRGPITQTSPDTEQGGVGRAKYAKTIPDQTQEKTNKQPTQEQNCQEKPRPENSENVSKLESYPPNSRKTPRKSALVMGSDPP